MRHLVWNDTPKVSRRESDKGSRTDRINNQDAAITSQANTRQEFTGQ